MSLTTQNYDDHFIKMIDLLQATTLLQIQLIPPNYVSHKIILKRLEMSV